MGAAPLLAIGLALMVAACAPVQSPSMAPRVNGEPPIELAPIDALLQQADAPTRAAGAGGAVSSRASALRDRAARLRRM